MARIASGELIAGDGDWHLVDVDPAARKRKYYRFHDGCEQFMTVEDQEDVMVQNNELLKRSQSDPQKEWRLEARIPMSTYFDQLHEAVEQKDEKYISKWINDSDNRGYRTHVGNA